MLADCIISGRRLAVGSVLEGTCVPKLHKVRPVNLHKISAQNILLRNTEETVQVLAPYLVA